MYYQDPIINRDEEKSSIWSKIIPALMAIAIAGSAIAVAVVSSFLIPTYRSLGMTDKVTLHIITIVLMVIACVYSVCALINLCIDSEFFKTTSDIGIFCGAVVLLVFYLAVMTPFLISGEDSIKEVLQTSFTRLSILPPGNFGTGSDKIWAKLQKDFACCGVQSFSDYDYIMSRAIITNSTFDPKFIPNVNTTRLNLSCPLAPDVTLDLAESYPVSGCLPKLVQRETVLRTLVVLPMIAFLAIACFRAGDRLAAPGPQQASMLTGTASAGFAEPEPGPMAPSVQPLNLEPAPVLSQPSAPLPSSAISGSKKTLNLPSMLSQRSQQRA